MQWDLIFYTGNGTVGRIIAKAAAAHLTPCILELGGKSPAIIDRGVDVKTMAQRIAAGKWWNNGQTCKAEAVPVLHDTRSLLSLSLSPPSHIGIAPDYLLVADEMREDFINALREVINDFYGDSANVDKSQSYSRVVNNNHWKRLTSLLTATKGKVVVGGQSDSAKNYIAPTVVVDVDGGDVLMKDEVGSVGVQWSNNVFRLLASSTCQLFGPILPVITYKTFEEALAFIWARDKPLAAYIYSDDSAKIQQFKERVSAGMLVVLVDCPAIRQIMHVVHAKVASSSTIALFILQWAFRYVGADIVFACIFWTIFPPTHSSAVSVLAATDHITGKPGSSRSRIRSVGSGGA